MSTSSTDSGVQEYLAGLAASGAAPLRAAAGAAADAAARRLYHQLGEALAALLAAADRPTRRALFAAAVAPLAARLAPLRVAQFAVLASSAAETPDAARALLAERLEAAGDDQAVRCLLLSARGALELAAGEPKACAGELARAERALHALAAPPAVVPAALYRAQAALCKVRGEAKAFYDAALRYLAHEPLAGIDDAEQTTLAHDLALAALASDEIYNFGELLAHPLFERRLRERWLGALLRAVNIGDIAGYEALCAEHKAAIGAEQALVDATQTLREKVSILALMTLALGRSARQRTLTFVEIADATKLQVDEVELLLMKALALGLVKGAIDEVEQTVNVDWVQPRVLDASQLEVVADRLEEWSELVGTQLAALDKSVPPGAFK